MKIMHECQFINDLNLNASNSSDFSNAFKKNLFEKNAFKNNEFEKNAFKNSALEINASNFNQKKMIFES